MFDAYSRYRALHELMAIIEVAIESPANPRAASVSSRDAVRLREVWRHMDDLCESGAAMEEALPIDELRRDVLSRVRAALSSGLSVIATDDTLRP